MQLFRFNEITDQRQRRWRSSAAGAVVILSLFGLISCGGEDSSSDVETEIGTTSATESNDAGSASEGSAAGSVESDDVAAQVIQVDDVWTYAIVDPSDENVGAMFMSISGGSDDDRLIGAEVPNDIAEGVVLVTSVPAQNSTGTSPVESEDTGNETEGGPRVLEPVDSFVIHAGATTEFAPGGNQLVLSDVQRAINPGESFELTLIFEGKGPVPVMVDVR